MSGEELYGCICEHMCVLVCACVWSKVVRDILGSRKIFSWFKTFTCVDGKVMRVIFFMSTIFSLPTPYFPHLKSSPFMLNDNNTHTLWLC